MRREESFERREDEPTRPVRVPRLRLSQETGPTLKITIEGTELTTGTVPAPRRVR